MSEVVKKTTRKSARKPKMEMVLEFAGQQYTMEAIQEKVREHIAKLYPDAAPKKISIYMQPETGYIFYTVDDQGGDEQFVEF